MKGCRGSNVIAYEVETPTSLHTSHLGVLIPCLMAMCIIKSLSKLSIGKCCHDQPLPG